MNKYIVIDITDDSYSFINAKNKKEAVRKARKKYSFGDYNYMEIQKISKKEYYELKK